jgi:DNA-binding response OmpR family regulator
VRTALARAIDAASYNVIAAADGPEGLTLLDDQTISVAIIDLRLPGRLDGIALARAAKRRNSNLRIILTSGWPPEADIRDLGEFLPKPVRVATVLESIACMLGLDKKTPPDRD